MTDASEEHEVLRGRVLGHGFAVGEPVGRGGMGVVFGARAEGPALMLHAELVPTHALVVKCVSSADAIPRLLAEDRLLAALSHPGFPQHVASGWEGKPGLGWSVRTRVPGVPLAPGQAGGATRAELLAVALSLTGALDHLHRAGFVHGDLAPSNLLWDRASGRARVLDLGTAVPAEGGAPGAGTTSGVLAYVAPECLRGATPTIRSDVWALGAVLWGVAHGVHPLPGYPSIAQARPGASPASPCTFDAVLSRMLAPEPTARPGDMRAVREALIAAALEADLSVIEESGPTGRDRYPYCDRGAAATRQAILQAAAEGRAMSASRRRSGRTRWLEEVTRTLGLELKRRVLVAAPDEDDPDSMLVELARGAGIDVGSVPGLAHVESLLRSGAIIALDLPAGATRCAEAARRLARRLEASAEAYAPTALLWTAPDEEPDPWTSEDLAALLEATYPRRHALRGSVAPLVEETGGEIGAVIETLHTMAAGGALLVDATSITLGEVPRAARGRPPVWLDTEARQALGLAAWAPGPVPLAALGERGPALQRAGVLTAGDPVRPANARWRRAGRESVEATTALEQLRHALLALGDTAGSLEVAVILGDIPATAEAFYALEHDAGPHRRRLAVALDGAGAAPPTPGAALALADALREAGRPERARHHLDALIANADTPPRLLAAGLGRRAAAALEQTAYTDAADDAERALETGSLVGSAALEATLVAARAHVLAGHRDEGQVLVARATHLIEEAGAHVTPLHRARLSWTEGIAAWFAGDLDRAAHELARGIDAVGVGLEAAGGAPDTRRALLSERAGLRIAEGLVAHRRGGDVALERAARRYEEGLADAEAAGDMARVLGALQNLGVVLHERGALIEALDSYRRALTLATTLDQPGRIAQIAGNLGNLHRYLGDVDEARRVLEAGLDAAETTQNRHARLITLNLLGDLDADAGLFGPARTRYLTALALAEEAGLAAEEAEIGLNLARVHLYQGERTDAERALRAGSDAAARGRLEGLAGQIAALEAEMARQTGAVVPDPVRAAMQAGFDAATNADTRWALAHQLALEARDRGASAEAARWAGEVETLLAAQRDAVPGPLQGRFNERRDRALALRDARSILAIGEAKLAHADTSGEGPEWARIVEVAKRVASERDVDRLLPYIMDTAVLLSGAERGFLVLARRPGDGEDVEVHLARNLDQENIRQRRDKISRTVVRRVIETAEPALTIDAMEDERYREKESVHAMRLRSILCVPMRFRGVALGAIYVDNRFQSAVFTEKDRRLLEALADLSAIALDTARSMARLEDQKNQLEAAREAVATLNARLETELARREAELEASREALRHEREARSPDDTFAGIVGTAPPMQRLYRLIERLRRADLPVLIEGESGTGKELVARAIHFGGPRQDRPFIALNCGAIPAGLIESELFGHVRGSFTNAHQDKRGLFEAADGGTLFLDEIGELPLELQVKLLRVLQSGEIQKVGSTRQIRVSVRILAATNRRLEDEIAAHRFREDLFYRLSVVRLALPPLRERREDIPLLVRHFLERHRTPEGPKTIARDALARLMAFDWPGNVRQLETVIRSALVFTDGPTLRPGDLPDLGPSPGPHPHSPQAPSAPDGGAIVPLADLERRAILRALELCQGNKSRAAKSLGIDRRTLYNKLSAWGLLDDA